MVFGPLVNLAAMPLRMLLPVHDVATAYGDELPAFLDDRRPGGPQLVGAVRLLYFNVKPTVVATEDVAGVYAAAREAAEALGLTITAEEAPSRFQALAVTRLMRFKDDVVVRVAPNGTGSTRVDVRSRSRLGQGDIGANGGRILAYQRRLQSALEARRLGTATSRL